MVWVFLTHWWPEPAEGIPKNRRFYVRAGKHYLENGRSRVPRGMCKGPTTRPNVYRAYVVRCAAPWLGLRGNHLGGGIRAEAVQVWFKHEDFETATRRGVCLAAQTFQRAKSCA